MPISIEQIIDNNTRRIMTHILKNWKVNKSSAHPSTYTLTTAKLVALKVYIIQTQTVLIILSGIVRIQLTLCCNFSITCLFYR